MNETETLVLALQDLHGMVFALGCIIAFGLGWIGGHQR